MRIMAFHTGVTRVRIIAFGFATHGRIMALCAQLPLVGSQHALFIGGMWIMAHLARTLLGRTVRRIFRELRGLRVMAIRANALHRALKRKRTADLRGNVAGTAIVIRKRRVFVTHHQRR